MTKALWTAMVKDLDRTNPPFAQWWRTMGFRPEHWPGPPRRERKRAGAFFKKVYKRCPFRAVYVDRKGLIADLLEPPDAADAGWLESEITRYNPEAHDVAGEEGLRNLIRKRGILRLWWD